MKQSRILSASSSLNFLCFSPLNIATHSIPRKRIHVLLRLPTHPPHLRTHQNRSNHSNSPSTSQAPTTSTKAANLAQTLGNKIDLLANFFVIKLPKGPFYNYSVTITDVTPKSTEGSGKGGKGKGKPQSSDPADIKAPINWRIFERSKKINSSSLTSQLWSTILA